MAGEKCSYRIAYEKHKRKAEQLQARVQALEAENAKLSGLLETTIDQACMGSDEWIDSMALSAYADALEHLSAIGRFDIFMKSGRRVLGKWRAPSRARGEGVTLCIIDGGHCTCQPDENSRSVTYTVTPVV